MAGLGLYHGRRGVRDLGPGGEGDCVILGF